MKTTGINGFAYWASYLVNNDATGLTCDDIDEIAQWARENDVSISNCLQADDDGIGWVTVGGTEMQSNCMYYTFSVAE